MRKALLLSMLLLSACTTTQQAGIRKTLELTEQGCRAYLTAFPSAKGRLAGVCRKVVQMGGEFTSLIISGHGK